MAAVAAQARRWYMLVRVYVPVTYALVLAGTTFLAAGWLSAIAARCLATGLPSRFSARPMRAGDARRRPRRPRHTPVGACRPCAEPAVPAGRPIPHTVAAVCNAGFAWSALAMRKTTWAGITYQLHGRKQVKVLSR